MKKLIIYLVLIVVVMTTIYTAVDILYKRHQEAVAFQEYLEWEAQDPYALK